MGRPRKIQVIRSDDFSNPSELTVSELRALSISSANDIPNFLSCVPTVTQGSPWTDSSALPSGADLRYALPGLDFVLCNFAETKQNLATYSQRCEVLLSKGHSALKSTLPPILWPTAVSPATASSQGWLCYFCSFFNFLCRRFVLKFRLFSLMHLIIKKILFLRFMSLSGFRFFSLPVPYWILLFLFNNFVCL